MSADDDIVESIQDTILNPDDPAGNDVDTEEPHDCFTLRKHRELCDLAQTLL